MAVNDRINETKRTEQKSEKKRILKWNWIKNRYYGRNAQSKCVRRTHTPKSNVHFSRYRSRPSSRRNDMKCISFFPLNYTHSICLCISLPAIAMTLTHTRMTEMRMSHGKCSGLHCIQAAQDASPMVSLLLFFSHFLLYFFLSGSSAQS